nr:hypothetical protein [Breoghania sp. L-A4]
MNEHLNALDAHVVIEDGAWARADAIKAEVKAVLLDDFGINHTTLELECARHACEPRQNIGHG